MKVETKYTSNFKNISFSLTVNTAYWLIDWLLYGVNLIFFGHYICNFVIVIFFFFGVLAAVAELP